MAQTKRRARGEDSIYYDIKLVELKVRDVDFGLASWLSTCQPGALGWPG